MPSHRACALVIGSFGVVMMTMAAPSAASAQTNPFSACGPARNSTRQLEFTPELIPERPGARRFRWTGSTLNPVAITCDDTFLLANQIVYEDDTRILEATGNVVLQQNNLTLYAERAEMNGETKLGTFFKARGSARLGAAAGQKSQFGTMEPDVYFFGDEVSKVGDGKYHLKGGGFTTCVQPAPRWEMTGSTGSLTLDKHAILRNVVLKVKNVPIFYLPAIYYPMNKEDRATGFLLPTYGVNSAQGTVISNAFFLALGRSHDATFYHDWYTKTGQGYAAEYRFAYSPLSRGDLKVHLERFDIGETGTVGRSYRILGSANQGLGRFQLIGNANYSTNPLRRQLSQDINEASRRDRTISFTVSGAKNRYQMSASTKVSDYFVFVPQTTGPTGEIEWTQLGQRSGQFPVVNVTVGDTAIGRSKIYYGASGEAGYLLRQDNLSDSATNRNLWRTNTSPRIRAPLSTLPFLSVTATASWQMTTWSESLDADGVQVAAGLTRQLFTARADIVGPTVARVFQTPNNGYAERFKHLIEPKITFLRTTAFRDLARVAGNDTSDREAGGNTQIEYGITNSLLVRRAQSGEGPPKIRTLLNVTLRQSYYSNAFASIADPNYQTRSSADNFSALQLTSRLSPADTASTDFTMEIDARFREIREIRANTTIDQPRVRVAAGWSKRLVVPGRIEFGPDQASHAFNVSTSLKTLDNRVGGTYLLSYDLRRTTFQNQRLMLYYNSQCCGLSVDWQSSPKPVLNQPSNQHLSFGFTLAGIGSFSNPFGSFGGQ